MTKPKHRYIVHPERAAHVDAVGIVLCDECYERYRDERHESNGEFAKRPFLRELVARQHVLSLIKVTEL